MKLGLGDLEVGLSVKWHGADPLLLLERLVQPPDVHQSLMDTELLQLSDSLLTDQPLNHINSYHHHHHH